MQNTMTGIHQTNPNSKFATWKRGFNKWCFKAQYILLILANTQNVSTVDKSVWHIFLSTGNLFYLTQINVWIKVYNWAYYLLVCCKLFMFSFLCLQTIICFYHLFCLFCLQDFCIPPPKKNNGPSLWKTNCPSQ